MLLCLEVKPKALQEHPLSYIYSQRCTYPNRYEMSIRNGETTLCMAAAVKPVFEVGLCITRSTR